MSAVPPSQRPQSVVANPPGNEEPPKSPPVPSPPGPTPAPTPPLATDLLSARLAGAAEKQATAATVIADNDPRRVQALVDGAAAVQKVAADLTKTPAPEEVWLWSALASLRSGASGPDAIARAEAVFAAYRTKFIP